MSYFPQKSYKNWEILYLYYTTIYIFKVNIMVKLSEMDNIHQV